MVFTILIFFYCPGIIDYEHQSKGLDFIIPLHWISALVNMILSSVSLAMMENRITSKEKHLLLTIFAISLFNHLPCFVLMVKWYKKDPLSDDESGQMETDLEIMGLSKNERRRRRKKYGNIKTLFSNIDTDKEQTIFTIVFKRSLTKNDLKEMRSRRSLQEHGILSLLILYLHTPADHSLLEWVLGNYNQYIYFHLLANELLNFQ